MNRSIILRVFLCLFALLTLLAIPSMPAQAQTLTVLYSFTNSPNSAPMGIYPELWSGTSKATYMGLPTSAEHQVWAPCLRWTPLAARPCCTASP